MAQFATISLVRRDEENLRLSVENKNKKRENAFWRIQTRMQLHFMHCRILFIFTIEICRKSSRNQKSSYGKFSPWENNFSVKTEHLFWNNLATNDTLMLTKDRLSRIQRMFDSSISDAASVKELFRADSFSGIFQAHTKTAKNCTTVNFKIQ